MTRPVSHRGGAARRRAVSRPGRRPDAAGRALGPAGPGRPGGSGLGPPRAGRACWSAPASSTSGAWASPGWANSFYSAAVQAGTKSWKAFFFGSSDASNFITVDKPRPRCG